MGMNPEGNKTGDFGTVEWDGNELKIHIDPDSLGGIALTSGGDRIECFWDGTQWVCNSIDFGANASSKS